MSTSELINVMKKHKENRFILGIDGLSRSGKTTFVANLKGKYETGKHSVSYFSY